MFLTIVLAILSLGLTGLFYYFNNWWKVWWMFWIWIPLPFAFFCALFFLFLLYLAIASYFYKRQTVKKPSLFAMLIVHQTAYVIMLYLRIHVTIRGMGKLPEHKRRFMVVHNHLSSFDEFALIWAFRNYDMLFISKEENFDIPIVGGWIKKAGHLAIKQGDLVQGKQIISQAADYIKQGKYSITVAPEGTRNKNFPDPLLAPFHPGTFNMAKEAGCPIVVCAIQNTNATMQRWPVHMTHVYLDVVGVIDEEDVAKLTTNELAEKSRSLILKRFEEKEARFYHLKPKKEKKEETKEEK